MASCDTPAVAGLRLAAVSAGIKTPGRLDLVLMELPESATVAAVFTRNAFCAAPVQVAKRHLAAVAPRYLLVNTGNANAGTGEPGIVAAERCCQAVAEAFDVTPAQVLPFSTGVIGEPLPVEPILAALPAAVDQLAEDAWERAAEGILTTDTRPKLVSRQLQLGDATVTVTGMAKGAGMIRPDMATMLAYVATDAAVPTALLDTVWRRSVAGSFNRVTVDGDTSTNDAALLIATGGSGAAVDSESHPGYDALVAAIDEVALELAQALVRDGEGATKFVAVRVTGGRDEAECLDVAFTIAHSPLVKTALFASDPNWGRLLAAIGRAGIEDLAVERVEVLINGTLIAEGGCRAAGYSEAQGVAAMAPDEIEIEIRLDRGGEEATVWTSDLSYDYVRINAEYRT
jgi:glutamate N-acetyltransferase/amino-acid N-acetyltransferase